MESTVTTVLSRVAEASTGSMTDLKLLTAVLHPPADVATQLLATFGSLSRSAVPPRRAQ